jgi:hypothetical protein
MSQQYDIVASDLIEKGYRPIHAGDDYEHRFTVTRSSSALDLTGAKIWFTVKENSVESDAEAKLQLTSDDTTEIEITDVEGGIFLVKFKGSGGSQKDTSDLEGKWIYDIQVKLGAPDLTVITIAYGQIEFLQNLTRSTT